MDDDFAPFGRLDETPAAANHAAPVIIHLSSGRIQGCAYGQPQERQHSVVEGGTRTDRPRRASQERLRRRVGISFAFVIASQRCACRCTACARSLSRFFTEDDMAKKAKKAKKTAKAATKKVAKKTSKRKK